MFPGLSLLWAPAIFMVLLLIWPLDGTDFKLSRRAHWLLVTEAAINILQFPASYQHGKVQITQRKHLLPSSPMQELFAVPGDIAQFSLLLWSHIFPVTMLQIYSAGGKLRDWLIDFISSLAKIAEGEAITSASGYRVSLEAYHLTSYYILTCLFIVCPCQ